MEFGALLSGVASKHFTAEIRRQRVAAGAYTAAICACHIPLSHAMMSQAAL
eukprot:SAG11_NODE_11486_length_757_cov_1.693009_1_plen_50_part_10